MVSCVCLARPPHGRLTWPRSPGARDASGYAGGARGAWLAAPLRRLRSTGEAALRRPRSPRAPAGDARAGARRERGRRSAAGRATPAHAPLPGITRASGAGGARAGRCSRWAPEAGIDAEPACEAPGDAAGGSERAHAPSRILNGPRDPGRRTRRRMWDVPRSMRDGVPGAREAAGGAVPCRARPGEISGGARRRPPGAPAGPLGRSLRGRVRQRLRVSRAPCGRVRLGLPRHGLRLGVRDAGPLRVQDVLGQRPLRRRRRGVLRVLGRRRLGRCPRGGLQRARPRCPRGRGSRCAERYVGDKVDGGAQLLLGMRRGFRSGPAFSATFQISVASRPPP
jgi:hypothetical protein